MSSVLLTFMRFGPYHWARALAAAKLLRLTTLEFDPDDRTHAWDRTAAPASIDHVALSRTRPDGRGKPARDERIGELLRSRKWAAIALPGWADPTVIEYLRAARELEIPTILMSASTAWDAPRVGWREAIKRRIVRMFDAALVGGGPQADYVAELGMPRDRIFLGYDAVDNAHFAAPAPPPPELAALGQRPFFLASARFIAEKNLPRFLQAFARYRALAGPEAWSLVLLGDGELRPDLEELARKLELGTSLFMPGFKQYAELPSWYQAASCFVLASTSEQWGLVVNEAMAAGLPVLVSNRCGCARDLVREGINGFTFDPYDVEALARLMWRTAHGELDRTAMGLESRRIIADWGPERFAEGLEAAVECALARPRRPFGPVDRLLLRALARQ